MKFTPESLIEIYLNGSFTDEAQAEFDRLMRSDAAFAEKVTNALAENMGPLPEGLENRIAERLDAKRESIWKAREPMPGSGILSLAAKAFLLVLAVGGGFWMLRHFWGGRPTALGPISGQVRGSGPRVSMFLPSETEPGRIPGQPSLRIRIHHPISAQPSGIVPSGTKDGPNLRETGSSEGTRPSSSSPQDSQMKPAVSRPAPNVNRGAGPEPMARTSGTGPSIPSSVPSSEEGDSLRVSVDMENSGKVIITVLDSSGLLVRRLYQGDWNQGTHFLDWDGKDEAGNQVQPGNYTVAVNADGKTMTGDLTIRSDR